MAAGLKASIHNPNVSEEAKQRAAERLESMGTGETLGQHTVSPPSSEHEQSRVLGGYKATLASEWLVAPYPQIHIDQCVSHR